MGNVIYFAAILFFLLIGSSASTEVGVVHLEGNYGLPITGQVYFITLNTTHVWTWVLITGLSDHVGTQHGLHVHLYGDITQVNAAGGHFIGAGEDIHACENVSMRHQGDMGNWDMTEDGTIKGSKALDLLSLSGEFSIIGRAVVLHNASDDCSSYPSGNSGSRLAQGVIGIANLTNLPAEVTAQLNESNSSTQVNDTNTATSGAASVPYAVAVLTPISGSSVSGIVTFSQEGNKVTVAARVTGLNATNAYGFHIHSFGDLHSSDGMATGSHYNPFDSPHGFPGDDRHVGDLGNICSFDEDGIAYYNFTFDSLVTLDGVNNVIGRAVIIHAIRDDGGKTYGPRIAQGVIGIVNSTQLTIPSSVVLNSPACMPTPEIGVAKVSGGQYDPTVTGYVYFVTLNSSHVFVFANISGITQNPDGLHGLHVHELGDVSDPTGNSAGGHYIGAGSITHGCEGASIRSEGDMGNWNATSGTIYESKILNLLALKNSFSIIGRAVILHADPDDCSSNATSAGLRIAQGAVGIANPAKLPPIVAAVAQTTPNSTSNDAFGRGIGKVIAVVEPMYGSNVQGLVTFEQDGDAVIVRARIYGLNSSQAYGFHIHTYGDLSSKDGTSASGHYDPFHAPHALPPANRHVGDLGNICSFGPDGTAYYYTVFDFPLSLIEDANIVGRSVVIHDRRDDGGSTFGNRIGQGVIGLTSNKTYITFPSDIAIHAPTCTPASTATSGIATSGVPTGGIATSGLVTSGLATTGSTIPTRPPISSTTGKAADVDGHKSGLSAGAKAAIVIFVLIFAGVLLYTFVYYMRFGRLFFMPGQKRKSGEGSIDYVAFEDTL